MPEFLRVKSVAGKIEGIIADARERLIIVSPYIKVSDTFLSRLKGAERHHVPITFVLREGDNKPAEAEKLQSVPNLSLYALKDLHAKCYLNEKSLVITSLNLYDTSEKNWEMGVAFTADELVYQEALEEVNGIVAAATQIHSPRRAASKISVPAVKSPPPKDRAAAAPAVKGRSKRAAGTCIRCGGDVAYNPAAPLCRACWTTWADFKNPDYPEHFCHDCGRTANTTMSHPRCKPCYSAARA